MLKELKFRVNGQPYALLLKPNTCLVDVLRDELNLTGTKASCQSGYCGVCTILLDGKPVKSCSILALQANGKEVTTIEGLADGDRLHPVQQAFIDHFAVQCGFCTPGMILAAKALLDDNPDPTEDEVREALHGNLCRCTGYVKIIEAVLAAKEKMRV
jgi:aerobic-type carbon monoxide dehydrogenase small subunit (CoxS/CutS family)